MLNGLLDVIQKSLADGDNVQLVGFGTFSVSERASREGRNPATGKTMTIPAKKGVKFKPGKTLSDAATADNSARVAESGKAKSVGKKK